MESVKCIEFCAAVGEGRLSDVRHLLGGGIEINQRFSNGLTPLHFACVQGHKEIVEYLMENGATVNEVNVNGLTPLMSACSQGFFSLAKFLVSSGAIVNSLYSNQDSPLLYLCKARMKQTTLNIGISSIHGFYKICHSENTCGCLDLVKLLVEAGGDVNFVDCDGMSPLLGFILSKHFGVAKFLIHSGANVNYVGKEGVTALLLTCQLKHSLELIETLVSAGADVNHSSSSEGTTPLMCACYNSIESVDTLIHAGASVNATNFRGETALKCAVFATNPSVIESLIKAGIKIDKELLLAVIIGHGESIQTLITNGALPRASESMQSLKHDVKYLSRRFNVWASNFLGHRLLVHLQAFDINSLTPFAVALMRKDNAVAKYFVRNLFFHPFDILLLQKFRQRKSTLEDIGISPCMLTLITQPWSLFSLSFLCVSFYVGSDSDREERISATGLPQPLQLMLLFRSKHAFLPVRDWANAEVCI